MASNRKKLALYVDVDEYFLKLRANVVLAELALMQLVAVTERLVERKDLADDLRVNLEVQEQALKVMLVLGIARMFDPKGRKQDQLSILNIQESQKLVLNEKQRAEIRRLASLPAVKTYSTYAKYFCSRFPCKFFRYRSSSH